MVNLKMYGLLILASVFLKSCAEKEKTFEVQGTIVSRQTQLPISGLNIQLDNLNFLLDYNKYPVKTDSLGRFIIRLTTKKQNAYLMMYQDNYDSLEYVKTETILKPGLSTIETDFPEYSLLQLFLSNKYSPETSRIGLKLLSEDNRISPEYDYDYNYEKDIYNTSVTFFNDQPIAYLSGTFLKYELTFNSNSYNQQSYSIIDSIYIPFSKSLVKDTIFY